MDSEISNVVQIPKGLPLHLRIFDFKLDPHNRDFAPQALELLTSPPSPIHTRLMLAICAFFATALAMSWFGRVDIYAVGQARIQPSGHSKVVQSLTGGRVRGIHVISGSHVKEGDLLMELDATEMQADQVVTERQLSALRAEIHRRTAAIAVARSGELGSTPPTSLGMENSDSAARERETAVFLAEMANLSSSLAAMDARIAERETQKMALPPQIEQAEALVRSLRNRLEIRRSLYEQKLDSKVSLMESEEQLAREMQRLEDRRGVLSTTRAAIESLRSERAELLSAFIAENSRLLEAAQRQHDELVQTLVKASARVEYTRITAPTDGTVQQLAVTTIGQVVSAGQPLMVLVPAKAPLEAEALVPNKDIAFIEPNQHAVLKVDAFPFTRYGVLSGKVVRVSRDALTHQQAQQLADASSVAISSQRSALSAVPQMSNLVYSVVIQLDQANVNVDGRQVPLLPGMSATAEIKTGERRVLEYFLSPVLEAASKAGHER